MRASLGVMGEAFPGRKGVGLTGFGLYTVKPHSLLMSVSGVNHGAIEKCDSPIEVLHLCFQMFKHSGFSKTISALTCTLGC